MSSRVRVRLGEGIQEGPQGEAGRGALRLDYGGLQEEVTLGLFTGCMGYFSFPFFKVYFLDYAITVVPIFPPLPNIPFPPAMPPPP